MARGLGLLPWPVRLAVTLPVAAMMIFANYTAFSNKRSFESLQKQERSGAEHAPVARVAPPSPRPHHHDPDAYYPSEHGYSEAEEGHPEMWAAVTAGGAGLAVLAGGLGLFSLFGGGRADEDDGPPPEIEGSPFV